MDDLNLVTILAREMRTLSEEFRKTQNAVERRPEFVAHHGQKFGLGPIGRFGPIKRLAQIDLQIFSFGNVLLDRDDMDDFPAFIENR